MPVAVSVTPVMKPALTKAVWFGVNFGAGVKFHVKGMWAGRVDVREYMTGKPFDLLYSTAARWRDGKIIEEYLFYDNGTFLSQVGLA